MIDFTHPVGRPGRTLHDGFVDEVSSRRCHAKGLAEELAKGRAKVVRRMPSSRGVEASEGLPADVPGSAESPEDDVASAAPACESERGYRARILRHRRR